MKNEGFSPPKSGSLTNDLVLKQRTMLRNYKDRSISLIVLSETIMLIQNKFSHQFITLDIKGLDRYPVHVSNFRGQKAHRLIFDVMIEKSDCQIKIKSSLYSRYYAEACNEWWPISAAWRLGNTAPKKRRNGGEPLATLCWFDQLEIQTPDLPHR